MLNEVLPGRTAVHRKHENQLRQYVDASNVFAAHARARKAAGEVRGSMFWREMRGVNTLICTSAAGAQRSLGAESEQTREVYPRFVARKAQVSQSERGLHERLEEMRKLNKVYGGELGSNTNLVRVWRTSRSRSTVGGTPQGRRCRRSSTKSTAWSPKLTDAGKPIRDCATWRVLPQPTAQDAFPQPQPLQRDRSRPNSCAPGYCENR